MLDLKLIFTCDPKLNYKRDYSLIIYSILGYLLIMCKIIHKITDYAKGRIKIVRVNNILGVCSF